MHFSPQEWADFTRGAAPSELAARMQDHLDQGCSSCASASTLWRTIADTAAKESAYQPPDHTVRAAKSLFGVLQGAASRQRGPARLVFDSLSHPLLAGIRSRATAARQLLFTDGPFRVDTRLESSPGPDRVSLMGQVLAEPEADAGDSGGGVAYLTVLLFEGERAVAVAATNRFGEFHLEFKAAADQRLWIVVSRRRQILIPLPSPEEQQEVEAS
jgi:hypothetical protein